MYGEYIYSKQIGLIFYFINISIDAIKITSEHNTQWEFPFSLLYRQVVVCIDIHTRMWCSFLINIWFPLLSRSESLSFKYVNKLCCHNNESKDNFFFSSELSGNCKNSVVIRKLAKRLVKYKIIYFFGLILIIFIQWFF